MKRFALFILLLAATLCSVAARPVLSRDNLAEYFRKQLHKWDDYKILIIKGKTPTADVDRLVANPDAFYLVVWQALPMNTRESDTARVMQWVANGGCVWFQDSRLAPHFGMENAPVEGKDIAYCRPGHGEYGGIKKFEGAHGFAVVDPGRGHPTLQGVDYVQMFALKVGEAPPPDKDRPGSLYSAVKKTADVIPLLRIDPTSASPVADRLAAALRPHGQGNVVFKPLIWEEQYTGARFHYNLLEWSTGFGVPDVTASGPSGRRSRAKNKTSGDLPPPARKDK